MGGEKLASFAPSSRTLGSPPHGRGKAFSVLRRQFRFRITPAWAGKRARCPCWCAGGQDHPRMGGEKSPGRALRCCIRGSPPRRRGKAKTKLAQPLQAGITPAWAGKSLPRWTADRRQKDHPRMGGEKFTASARNSGMTGSPPHGRGKALFWACR